MITLIRYILLQQKRIKYRLAFYTLLDDILKDGKAKEMFESFQKDLVKELAPIIHDHVNRERENMNKDNVNSWAEK